MQVIDVTTAADTVVVHKLTDMGNAERLADRAKGRLLYVDGLGWLYWDETRWKRDTVGRVNQEAKTAVRGIYTEAHEADDPDERSMISKHAVRSENTGRIDAMIKQARSEPRLRLGGVNELDAHSNVINVQNGILALDAKGDGSNIIELYPHDPRVLLTKIAGAPYHREATCPTWEKLLERILPDPALRAWVQMAAGYSMLGSYSEWLFIPYGAGANGKSTFLHGLRNVLGEYATEASSELLTEKREHSAGADAALAGLRGARLVTTIETRQGKRMAEALMKQLTGESEITAKFMAQNYFTFENQAAVWLATNHKPIVQGTDYGVWRRVRLIPFEVTIPEKDQIDQAEMKRALVAEADGILRWLVDGVRAYRRNGSSLDPAPAAVMEATEAYRQEMDALGEWLEDCCVIGPDQMIPVAMLRESYEKHCKETGRTMVMGRRFNAELEELGLKRKQVKLLEKNVKCWDGIGVTLGVWHVEFGDGKYFPVRPDTVTGIRSNQ